MELRRVGRSEIELVFADGPVLGRSTGVDAMLDSTRDFTGAWEDFRMEAGECREIDEERVLVLDHYRGRGKTSGLRSGRCMSPQRICSTSATAR